MPTYANFAALIFSAAALITESPPHLTTPADVTLPYCAASTAAAGLLLATLFLGGVNHDPGASLC